jgi:hypothetical protein
VLGICGQRIFALGICAVISEIICQRTRKDDVAKKIFALKICENKSLRELTLFNLQICLFRIWFQKYTKQCRSVQWRQKLFVKSNQDVDIWMEIPIIAKSQCWVFAGNGYLPPVYAQWSQRLYVNVQGKMMHKDMHKIVFQSN